MPHSSSVILTLHIQSGLCKVDETLAVKVCTSQYLSSVLDIGLPLHQHVDHLVTTLETGQCQCCVPVGLNLQGDIRSSSIHVCTQTTSTLHTLCHFIFLTHCTRCAYCIHTPFCFARVQHWRISTVMENTRWVDPAL